MRSVSQPGVTGLSRISGVEGASSPEELAALDAYYVQNWSLSGDAKILMRWFMQCLMGWADASGGPPPRSGR